MMALVGVLCFGSRVASQGLGLSTLKIRSMREAAPTEPSAQAKVLAIIDRSMHMEYWRDTNLSASELSGEAECTRSLMLLMPYPTIWAYTTKT